LNGLGQWLAPTRREAFKLAWVAPKYSENGGSSVTSETPKPEKVAPTEQPGTQEYFTIKTVRAPFHVIEAGESQTQLLELETGTVGRKHGEGDEWAWLQLESGLMGLMKKRYIRPALDSEVVAFLAAEAKSRGASPSQRREVRYVEVDLPAEPIPEVSASQTTPSPPLSAEEPIASTATQPIPASPPPKLPSFPPDASGAAGVIAVPSPVPILP
jgi:hypothetical protein